MNMHIMISYGITDVFNVVKMIRITHDKHDLFDNKLCS